MQQVSQFSVKYISWKCRRVLMWCCLALVGLRASCGKKKVGEKSSAHPPAPPPPTFGDTRWSSSFERYYLLQPITSPTACRLNVVSGQLATYSRTWMTHPVCKTNRANTNPNPNPIKPIRPNQPTVSTSPFVSYRVHVNHFLE